MAPQAPGPAFERPQGRKPRALRRRACRKLYGDLALRLGLSVLVFETATMEWQGQRLR